MEMFACLNEDKNIRRLTRYCMVELWWLRVIENLRALFPKLASRKQELIFIIILI